jgi:hypothetical protein
MDLSRRLRHPISSLLVGSLLLALPATLRAQAQATTGVIRGTVQDSTGTLKRNRHPSQSRNQRRENADHQCEWRVRSDASPGGPVRCPG